MLRAVPDRIAATAELAARWITLRRTNTSDRRVALVLANYPNRDGRLANGVGLDTPESLIEASAGHADAGYDTGAAPHDNAAMMQGIAGRSDQRSVRSDDPAVAASSWPLAEYERALATMPESLRLAADPAGDHRSRIRISAAMLFISACIGSAISLSAFSRRAVTTSIPRAAITIPDLVPPHHYLAFYLWLRREFAACMRSAHLGKHGNLEWLPGKSTGLSADCTPDAILGPVPHLYPFIVNDPGEGIQAKRRTSAVIIDHLTPPMTRAELHDDLARMETLVDEYALAADLDPKRAGGHRRRYFVSWRDRSGSMRMSASTRDTPVQEALRAIDAHLLRPEGNADPRRPACVWPGAHRWTSSRDDLHRSRSRGFPRSEIRLEDASLHRALARRPRSWRFRSADARSRAPIMDGTRPAIAGKRRRQLHGAPAGDTVERIEQLALQLVVGVQPREGGMEPTR